MFNFSIYCLLVRLEVAAFPWSKQLAKYFLCHFVAALWAHGLHEQIQLLLAKSEAVAIQK